MIRRTLCAVLAALMIITGIAAPAQAAVVGTAEALAMDARQSRISAIESQLARAEVRQAMIAMGVDPAAAQVRIASLSDAELAQLAGELESLPAGGSALALIGAVFVVLLILELVGVTDIFNKP